MRNICRVFAAFAALLAGVALVNAQSARELGPGGKGPDRPSPEAPSSKAPRSTGVPGANPVSPSSLPR
jgi:hypothetical protein